jgi:hypothetical protein
LTSFGYRCRKTTLMGPAKALDVGLVPTLVLFAARRRGERVDLWN